MTRPSIEVDDQRDHDGSSSVGCGAADAGKAGGSLTEVDVLEQGSLGDYDYVRIESSSADAVVEWLQTNEYRVPADAASALQPYADGGMEFVGVKLSRPTDPDDIEDVLATPLVISTPRGADTWPSYPLALSAFSSPERMSVLFYVIADERARIDNYAHVEMSTVADRIAREREELRYVSSYDAIIDALTGENDGRLFVTEAAMPVSADATDHPALAELVGDEDAFLTRIYGRLKPSELDDVIFRPHDQPAAPVSPEQSRVIEGHERHAACSAFGGPSDALPMPIYLLVAFGACRLLWGHNRRSTNR